MCAAFAQMVFRCALSKYLISLSDQVILEDSRIHSVLGLASLLLHQLVFHVRHVSVAVIAAYT